MPWPRTQPALPAFSSDGSRDDDSLADEAVLVAAARAQRHAFQPLYERYADSVYRYCYLRLGSRELAEDATSEVFLKAIAGLDTYRGTGNGLFAGWLFRIASNVVTDSYRRSRASRRHLPLEAADTVPDPANRPEELAMTASDLDRLRTALRTLPADQRSMIELQLADLSTEQIAAALGRSPNAVRQLRHRAQVALRRALSVTEPGREGGAQ